MPATRHHPPPRHRQRRRGPQPASNPAPRCPDGLATRDAIPAGHKLASDRHRSPANRSVSSVRSSASPAPPSPPATGSTSTTSLSARAKPASTKPAPPKPTVPTRRSTLPTTFQGYRRADGRAGTRNMIGVLSSVNCSATVSRLVAREAERTGLLDEHPGIDGIVPIVHGAGCGLATSGEAFDLLQRTLRGYATHPNFAAVLVIGLGCEVMQIPRLVASLPPGASDRVHPLVIQEQGGTTSTVRAALDKLREILPAPPPPDAKPSPSPTSSWPCNAAARTAIQASPPTPPWVRPPTSSSRSAAPPSSPKPPRSTAPSTSSPAAPPPPRSPPSSCAASTGGATTPPVSAPR